MRKALALFFTILFAYNNVFSQSDKTEIKPLENIHLHLNKTTFSQGERLWFTAYIQEQNSKLPSLNTTNLQVAIYNKEGNVFKQKTFYVENGIAIGDFAIDSSFIGQEYTVLGFTNYMRNFKRLSPFKQKIKVLQDVAEVFNEDSVLEKIEVYPEGGSLIANAFNSCGVRLLDQYGNGVAQEGLVLLDSQGAILQSKITTDENGYGKLNFMLAQDQPYYLEYKNKKEELVRKELPKPDEDEFGIHIDNTSEKQVIFKLVGSEELFDVKAGESYMLSVYQDENLFFEDIEIDIDEPLISIKRDLLPYGINTAVLLNLDLVPIARRMFFNYNTKNNRVKELEIEHCKVGDSLQIDLLVSSKNTGATSISASILPVNTLAYNPDNSISSSFVLTPYIDNTFGLKEYLSTKNRQGLYKLDSRLLIEGWGKYNWDSRSKQKAKERYAFENGFKISGKVLDADLEEENQVYLVTDQTRAMVYEDLNKNKGFTTSMLLFEGDSIGVSLIGKKGKLRKAEINLDFTNGGDERFLGDSYLIYYDSDRIRNTAYLEEQIALKLADGTISLDEVVVTENQEKDDKFQFTADLEGRLIRDVDIRKSPSVASYIQRLGFSVRISEGKLRAFSRMYPYPEAPIIIEGMVASQGEVIGMPLSRVQFVSYKKSRTTPFISIVLNQNYVSPENRNQYVKFLIQEGFTKPQEYFDPGYGQLESSLFQRYGVINWKSRINVTNDIPTSITIPTYGQNKIRLYVEGMSINGGLVSQEKTISISSN